MPLFRRGMTSDTIAFSVRCVKRELYSVGNGKLVNADVNGTTNIAHEGKQNLG